MARPVGARSMMSVEELSVLIAGGGVAALEAALTLADVAEGQARVELLAPEPLFWYRPASVAEPFGLGTVRHFDLGLLAARAGAGMTLGALAGVDADRRLARTATGATLSYDALLIACGAQPTVAVPGALTFRGPADGPRLRALVEELEEGAVERVAFAVPSGSAWPLPAYELALMTARRLATTGQRPTAKSSWSRRSRVRSICSGAGRARRSGGSSREAGVAWSAARGPRSGTRRGAVLADGAIPADRVVALPRLRGPRIDGVPQTPRTVSSLSTTTARTSGRTGSFAAGDITAFTIKQGGIATQQAVAAAEAIAVLAGATLVPRPFRPVLRGLLLTGGQPTYLRHDLAEAGDGDWASGAPIWWPPTKIVGRRLSPFLAEIAGEVEVSHAELPSDAGIAVEAPIDRGAWTARRSQLAAASERAPSRAQRRVRPGADGSNGGIEVRSHSITSRSTTTPTRAARAPPLLTDGLQDARRRRPPTHRRSTAAMLAVARSPVPLRRVHGERGLLLSGTSSACTRLDEARERLAQAGLGRRGEWPVRVHHRRHRQPPLKVEVVDLYATDRPRPRHSHRPRPRRDRGRPRRARAQAGR